ncbi:hypothetical protein MPSEU_000244900 [Mayamaea pseudoterrestris]|nr:hypothetical protein MPSEU_000244900 [Mayamaea pseudoterrestris]
MTATDIALKYICPSLGCIMAAMVFAAPIQDLRRALANHSLGTLNPFPWVMMTGNCLGWVVYGYYTHDVFVVVANVPGLVLSIWLNSGASKLQYYERSVANCHRHQVGLTERARRTQNAEQWDAAAVVEPDGIVETRSYDSTESVVSVSSHASAMDPESLIMVPQEVALMRMLVAWAVVFMWVGWVNPANAANTIGIIVNINLVFFYGAPLQSIKTVLATGSSETLHVPTLYTMLLNSFFWTVYGLAQRNPIIILPNAIGFSLSTFQGFLIMLYPRKYRTVHEPLNQNEEAEFVGGDGQRRIPDAMEVV